LYNYLNISVHSKRRCSTVALSPWK